MGGWNPRHENKLFKKLFFIRHRYYCVKPELKQTETECNLAFMLLNAMLIHSERGKKSITCKKEKVILMFKWNFLYFDSTHCLLPSHWALLGVFIGDESSSGRKSLFLKHDAYESSWRRQIASALRNSYKN